MAKDKKSGKGGGKGKGKRNSGGQDKSTSKAGSPAEDATRLSFTDALRVGVGFSLAKLDTRSTPAFEGDKEAGEAALSAVAGAISELQERLFAESKIDGNRSLLLVVQGMDTSGKGGIMRHVVGEMDPQGVKYTAFKAPTAAEKRHHFLWRIRRALPAPGQVGVFDRSHYEDVLIARVRELVPREVWRHRYTEINEFEKEAADAGTTIVKVMLHISSDEQKARLTQRLERADKHWKWNPGDIDERQHWPDYQAAYQDAVTECSTDAGPWFVVPADRKWYARLAVSSLVLEHLRALDPQWPVVDFDVEAEKKRLAAT